MKTTPRFDRAVTKLYNAFHHGELNALDCHACAVGNMCDGNWDWAGARSIGMGQPNLTAPKESLDCIARTGYRVEEIIEIESLFMHGRKTNETFESKRFNRPRTENMLSDGRDIDTNFKGLCAVIEYLAELDNIPNPMDYSKLFETENNKPKYELNLRP